MTRYLRAVYILRTINPGDHWPKVAIPAAIRKDDVTNALLLHNDSAFVLTTLSKDLSAAMDKKLSPSAGYFAAHALSMLGQHMEASQAMTVYLAGVKFREFDYLFLMRERYKANDFTGVREAARLWQLHDGECREIRLAYVWGSYSAEGRHRNAMETVLLDPCASWQGQLLFAKSSLSLGDVNGANARLASTRQAFPEKNKEIHKLWNKLQSVSLYP